MFHLIVGLALLPMALATVACILGLGINLLRIILLLPVVLCVSVLRLLIGLPGGVIRAGRAVSHGAGIFVAEGGPREVLWMVTVCALVTLVLSPIFMVW